MILFQTYGKAVPNTLQNDMQNTDGNKDFLMNSEFHTYTVLRNNYLWLLLIHIIFMNITDLTIPYTLNL
jgi:hypothetical protein